MSGSGAVSAPARGARRRRWLAVHGWIAAITGVPFVLVGATGSFLVFYKTIDGWLNPDLARRRASGPALSLDRVADIARARFPSSHAISIEPPRNSFDVYRVSAEERADRAEEETWFRVSIDPASGDVLGESEWGRSLVSIVYEFHYSLLLGEVGKVMIATSAVSLFASLVSGLVLWWPGRRKLGKALKIRIDGSSERLNYDIHRSSGFYACVVLAILSFSGFYLLYPFLVVPAVRIFSPVRDWPESFATKAAPDVPALSLDRAVELALARHPSATFQGIEVHRASAEPLRIDLRQPGEVRSDGSTTVWLDGRTGEIVDEIDPKKKTAGETFLEWMFPLHNGEAFGLIGRWVVFFSGLALPTLGVTGLRLWLRRRRSLGRVRVRREKRWAASFR